MKNQNGFLLFLLLNLSWRVSAQTYTLGGRAETSIYSEHKKGESIDDKSKISKAFFTPSFQCFVNNRLMVGGSLTVGAFKYQSDLSYFHTVSNSASFVASPAVRYYFNEGVKWRFFSGLSAEYSTSKSNAEVSYLGQVANGSNRLSAFNWTPSVGANYFLKEDLALEIKLYHSRTAFTITNKEAGSLTSVTESSQFNQTNIGVDFQNFLTFGKPQTANKKKKSADEAPPQYIAAGKQLIGGSANWTRFVVGSGKTASEPQYTLAFAGDYGYFLTKNIAVGTQATIRTQFEKNDWKMGWNLSPYARFYQPIVPRIYAFAEAKVTLNRAQFYSQTTRNWETTLQKTYDLSLGCTYFLSPRVALEGNLYNFTYLKEQAAVTKTHNVGLSAQVRYFLN